MKYHVTLARNDVFGELAGSHFPRYYKKKKTGTPSFCTLLISSVLQLGSNDLTFFKIYSCQGILEKRGILEAFKYSASTFYFFVKKKVFVRYFTYFWHLVDEW